MRSKRRIEKELKAKPCANQIPHFGFVLSADASCRLQFHVAGQLQAGLVHLAEQFLHEPGWSHAVKARLVV